MSKRKNKKTSSGKKTSSSKRKNKKTSSSKKNQQRGQRTSTSNMKNDEKSVRRPQQLLPKKKHFCPQRSSLGRRVLVANAGLVGSLLGNVSANQNVVKIMKTVDGEDVSVGVGEEDLLGEENDFGGGKKDLLGEVRDCSSCTCWER